MFPAISIPIFNAFFARGGLNEVFLISSDVGMGITTPVIYYFVNNKRFKPLTMVWI